MNEENGDNFPLSVSGVTSTVWDILLEKHPSSHLPSPSALLPPSDFSSPPFQLVIFDNLDGVLVHHTILHMDGALDLMLLPGRSWCTCFIDAFHTLCDALCVLLLGGWPQHLLNRHVLILSLLVVSDCFGQTSWCAAYWSW